MDRLFPVEHHVPLTGLSPEQCRERLETIVRPLRSEISQVFAPSDRPLLGTVSSDDFSVRKASPLGNAFRHVAYGRFVFLDEGTRIPVRLGMTRLVLHS